MVIIIIIAICIILVVIVIISSKIIIIVTVTGIINIIGINSIVAVIPTPKGTTKAKAS